MILHSAGRELAHWPFTADYDPTGTDVQVYINGAWHDVNLDVDGGSPEWTGDITLLVAGPDVDALTNPPDTVVLDMGGNPALIRFPDTPELIVRSAGTITVTD